MASDGVLVSARPVAGVHPPSGGFYTSLAGADLLQSDQRTERRVREVLRFARAPQALLRRLSGPTLVLFRPLATPNHEVLRFLSLAREAGRTPVVLELLDDWFTPTVNPSKHRLGKLPICPGTPSRRRTTRCVTVTSFNREGRHRLRDLACSDGTPLVDFHHRLLAEIAGSVGLEALVDVTEFCAADAPRAYYERLFALFTCFGVLAESFATAGVEQGFTDQVIMPAWEATVARFGARPAIVELLPAKTVSDPYWESYPAAVLAPALKAARPCGSI